MRLPDHPAVAELARLKPAKLRVFTAAEPDVGKAVAIPNNRTKWANLARTLDGLDWLRIEALDARGNIVGVVAREEEPDEEEPDVDYDAAEAARDERMLALMLKAQSVALAAQERSQRPLIDGMAKLVGTVTTALDATSRAYNAALAAASSIPAGGAGGDGNEDVTKFMQMVMMLAMRSGQPGIATAAGVVADAQRVAAAKPAVPGPSKPNGAQQPSKPPAPGH